MQGHAKSGHGRFMINIQQSTRLFVFRFLIEKDRMEIFRRNHLYRNSPGGNRALLQQQCLVQIMRSDEDIVRNHDDALSLARKAVEKTVEVKSEFRPGFPAALRPSAQIGEEQEQSASKNASLQKSAERAAAEHPDHMRNRQSHKSDHIRYS